MIVRLIGPAFAVVVGPGRPTSARRDRTAERAGRGGVRVGGRNRRVRPRRRPNRAQSRNLRLHQIAADLVHRTAGTDPTNTESESTDTEPLADP
jgi:hypothetical protein